MKVQFIILKTLLLKYFYTDNTYFILNGTSTSNKVVINTILSPVNLVLYDRNNHKSVYHIALIFEEISLYIYKLQ